MSILSEFEDRVSSAVEGMFAGVFRAPVQPAELARACGKEMDKRRKLGVGKIYAPTLYSVLLSPADGDQLGGFASTLAGELETYLVGYARQKGYQFSTKPRVRFLVDEGLKLGRYEVIGELLSDDEIAAEIGDEDEYFEPEEKAPRAPAPTRPVVAGASVPTPAPARDEVASLTLPAGEGRVPLTGDRIVLGRLKSCDVCLQDKNASREHAALEHSETGWVLVDLDSTNGTLLNGEPAHRARLRDGDVITVGVSEMVFNEARSAR